MVHRTSGVSSKWRSTLKRWAVSPSSSARRRISSAKVASPSRDRAIRLNPGCLRVKSDSRPDSHAILTQRVATSTTVVRESGDRTMVDGRAGPDSGSRAGEGDSRRASRSTGIPSEAACQRRRARS